MTDLDALELERALAIYRRMSKEDSAFGTPGMQSVGNEVRNAFIDGHDFRARYYDASHVEILCHSCSTPGRGVMLNLLLAGWRTKGSNYYCPAHAHFVTGPIEEPPVERGE